MVIPLVLAHAPSLVDAEKRAKSRSGPAQLPQRRVRALPTAGEDEIDAAWAAFIVEHRPHGVTSTFGGSSTKPIDTLGGAADHARTLNAAGERAGKREREGVL